MSDDLLIKYETELDLRFKFQNENELLKDRIVELEAEIVGLKNQIQNQQMCIYEHNSALVGTPIKREKGEWEKR